MLREWLFGCISALGIFSRFTFLFLAIPIGLFCMYEINDPPVTKLNTLTDAYAQIYIYLHPCTHAHTE